MVSNDSFDEGLDRALRSLEGLSVGDAFGQCFFVHPAAEERLIMDRALPKSPWLWTDDTMMSLSIVSILRQYAEIRQDELAKSFAEHYAWDRLYGPAMEGLFAEIRSGQHWRDVSSGLFGGQGSFGNGAAMRAAPLGAFFADDLSRAAEQAERSAEVTHAHPEAIAGAIAVAVAAAVAWQWRGGQGGDRQAFIDSVLPFLPPSETRDAVVKARDLGPGMQAEQAASLLGNGSRVSAMDTVPFTLWCAGEHLDNYREALWHTLRGRGDRDTTCAIVGGIVALSSPGDSIPAEWRNAREALPDWAFSSH